MRYKVIAMMQQQQWAEWVPHEPNLPELPYRLDMKATIHETTGLMVVCFRDRPDNGGVSVTNSIEAVAKWSTFVYQHRGPVLVYQEEWEEPGVWCAVSFDVQRVWTNWGTPFEGPRWKPIKEDGVKAMYVHGGNARAAGATLGDKDAGTVAGGH